MGWIGVDLDGTLAHYEGWDDGNIGAPIPAMVDRVKEWIADGQDVRIFTARVSGPNGPGIIEQMQRIKRWCYTHIGKELAVTCQKDYAMVALYDDRCVQVEPNTGRLIGQIEEKVLV